MTYKTKPWNQGPSIHNPGYKCFTYGHWARFVSLRRLKRANTKLINGVPPSGRVEKRTMRVCGHD